MSTAILLALLVPVQPQVSVSGGVQVEAHVPTVQFEAEPALVVVAPGIMVVPDSEREVFFARGFYWYNLNGAWFRARSHRGGWVRVAYGRVPPGIIGMPRGKFRHFHGGTLYRRAGRVTRPRPVAHAAAARKKPVAAKTKTKAKAHTKTAHRMTAKKAAKHKATKKKARTAHAVKPKPHKARTAHAVKPRKARHARPARSSKVRSSRGANLRRRHTH